MNERAKIILNGKEMKKRFIGSTLVWEITEGLREIYNGYNGNEVTVNRFWDTSFFVTFPDGKNPSEEDLRSVTHIQINDKYILKLKSEVGYIDKKLVLLEHQTGGRYYNDVGDYLGIPAGDGKSRTYRMKLYTNKPPKNINYESYKKYDKFNIVGYYSSDSKLMFYRSGASAKTPELNNAKFKGVKFKDDVVMPLSDYRVENTPSGSFITFYNVSNEMKEYFFKNKGGTSRGDGFGSFKTVLYYE